ncbi:MAG: hypothetical protein IH851_11495, partial [Armatimonadetes bacterium]|nr:hypothetical protein [Armatimonadota bacterium]
EAVPLGEVEMEMLRKFSLEEQVESEGGTPVEGKRRARDPVAGVEEE